VTYPVPLRWIYDAEPDTDPPGVVVTGRFLDVEAAEPPAAVLNLIAESVSSPQPVSGNDLDLSPSRTDNRYRIGKPARRPALPA
jgi:hypothetical protein